MVQMSHHFYFLFLLSTLMFVWNSVGRPRFVITDIGTNHIHRAIRSENIDILWWTTTLLSPQMNGTAERFVKLTKSCLTIFESPILIIISNFQSLKKSSGLLTHARYYIQIDQYQRTNWCSDAPHMYHPQWTQRLILRNNIATMQPYATDSHYSGRLNSSTYHGSENPK